MKIKTKGHIAIAAVLDIALHGTEEPVTLAEISERQEVSLSYLEQLFGRLREDGIVLSKRGPGGGYQLSRKPDSISVAEVVNAVDKDTLHTRTCGGAGRCREDDPCLAHNLWSGLNDHLNGYLQSVTLGNILAESRNRPATAQPAQPAPPPVQHAEAIAAHA